VEAIVSRYPRIKCRERLSRFSSIRIGGPVENVAFVSTTSDLEKILEMQERGAVPAPLVFVGRGTNILFPDEGFGGTLVRFEQTDLSAGCRWEECGRVSVDAGYPLPALAREAARKGVHGFEFLGCIPGTVGGASVMNAGAGGKDWSGLCRDVTVLTRSGQILTVPVEGMKYRYRSSVLSERRSSGGGMAGPPFSETGDLSGAVVLRATLEGKLSTSAHCQETLSAHLSYRKATQPLDEPSLGSVFKNPAISPGGYTSGKLIEESGLKGISRGGIMVSPRHANFFVNTGEGRARDFMELLSIVIERVNDRWGIILEPEVRVWSA